MFWLAAGLTFFAWCLILLLLPETSAESPSEVNTKLTEEGPLYEEAQERQQHCRWRHWLFAPLKPFQAMTLLLYPNIFLASLINGFPYVYMLTITSLNCTHTQILGMLDTHNLLNLLDLVL